MKMGNREQSGWGGRNDWRVRISGAVGAGAALTLALLLGPVVGIDGLWQGMIAVAVAVTVGTVLGQFVGGLLFRPSSSESPDAPPPA
jgi:hypothetical protein